VQQVGGSRFVRRPVWGRSPLRWRRRQSCCFPMPLWRPQQRSARRKAPSFALTRATTSRLHRAPPSPVRSDGSRVRRNRRDRCQLERDRSLRRALAAGSAPPTLTSGTRLRPRSRNRRPCSSRRRGAALARAPGGTRTVSAPTTSSSRSICVRRCARRRCSSHCSTWPVVACRRSTASRATRCAPPPGARPTPGPGRRAHHPRSSTGSYGTCENGRPRESSPKLIGRLNGCAASTSSSTGTWSSPMSSVSLATPTLRWTPTTAGPAASPASSATRPGTRSISRTRSTSAWSSRPSQRSPGRLGEPA